MEQRMKRACFTTLEMQILLVRLMGARFVEVRKRIMFIL
jgi:hypothetical protein